jgi:hypothetical protein
MIFFSVIISLSKAVAYKNGFKAILASGLLERHRICQPSSFSLNPDEPMYASTCIVSLLITKTAALLIFIARVKFT